MKLMGKNEGFFGTTVTYQWKAEELPSEKSCYKFVANVCKIGELVRIECSGYSDMDTHVNFCTFKTQKDFVNGLENVKKIDADRINVYLNISGERVEVEVGPCWDNEEGNWISVSGKENLVKAVSAKIQKMFA